MQMSFSPQQDKEHQDNRDSEEEEFVINTLIRKKHLLDVLVSL